MSRPLGDWAAWDDPAALRRALDVHVQGPDGWCVVCGDCSVGLRGWPCAVREFAAGRLARLERAGR